MRPEAQRLLESSYTSAGKQLGQAYYFISIYFYFIYLENISHLLGVRHCSKHWIKQLIFSILQIREWGHKRVQQSKVMGWTGLPPQFTCWSLTPRTSEGDCHMRYGLQRLMRLDEAVKVGPCIIGLVTSQEKDIWTHRWCQGYAHRAKTMQGHGQRAATWKPRRGTPEELNLSAPWSWRSSF